MTNIQQANQFKALGNTAFQAGRFEESIEHFTKAIQLNPNDHVFYSNRSGAYASLQQYDKALEDATKCVQKKPDWPKGYKRKGLAQFFLGKVDEAIETYKAGLKIDPNNAQLKQDLQRAESKKNQDSGDMDPNQMLKNPQALQMFMKLLSHPDTKDFIQDPSFMQNVQLLMKNPGMFATLAQRDPRLYKAFQVINSPDTNTDDIFKNMNIPKPQKTQKTQEAPKPQQKHRPPPKQEEKKEAPKKEQQKKPQKMDIENPAQALKNQGNAEFKKKNFAKALEYYDQAIALAPNQVLYYNNKAAAFIELGDFESANNELSKAQALINDGIVKDFVKKAKIYARKASIFTKQQKYADAIQWYEKSLVQDNVVSVKDELTRVKKLKKEYEIKAYINPELAEKHCESGNTLFKNGKFPEALKEYEEAIRRGPGVAKYHSNLGTTYIKLMEFNRAREQLETALKLDPNYVKAYPKKGDCHFAMKEYHKAMECYEKGLKLQPQNEACKAGISKTQTAIYNSSNSQDAEERARHAMADPQIQSILKTPEIQGVLNDLKNDPKSAAKAFSNPDIAAKLNKLIEAGILRTG